MKHLRILLKGIIWNWIVFLFSSSLSAQTIPGATKQPQWAMPFYFEDANGEKDTVWIGYDPEATPGIGGYDEEFNEWQRVNSSKFIAMVCPTCYSPFHTRPQDSVYKVDIQPFDYPLIHIGFINGKMPLTMRWDNSYFYSDSLPYPDISPKPRGRADMGCGNSEPPYFYCHTGTPGYPFVLTDQPRPYFKEVFQDSFFFDGSGNMPPAQAIVIEIIIMPYDAYFLGLKEKSKVEVKISPNPFSEQIHIYIPPHPDHQAYIIMQDMNGKVVWQKKEVSKGEEIIETSHWANGLYILHYVTNSSMFSYKIIKK